LDCSRGDDLDPAPFPRAAATADCNCERDPDRDAVLRLAYHKRFVFSLVAQQILARTHPLDSA
jgi:hypothetical protein